MRYLLIIIALFALTSCANKEWFETGRMARNRVREGRSWHKYYMNTGRYDGRMSANFFH